MLRVLSQVERLATSRASILIRGESGTGKEIVARALYDAAPRGEFVPIDCSSFSGGLIESELFGHTRGAFTGASESKIGLIQLAHGGTAFFDEIGDMAPELQVKLLRVIQEREIRPVGGLARSKIDIRVISATHRDLPRDVAEGRFRADLYHRLNVVTICMPPLRERREDIPLLTERFLADFGGTHSIEPDALRALLDYSWPGNVRELRNCLEGMVALSTSSVLGYHDLPDSVLSVSRPLAAAAAAGSGVKPSLVRASLREVERLAILDSVTFNGGSMAAAALTLGISRTTLYRKLKEYNCDSWAGEHPDGQCA